MATHANSTRTPLLPPLGAVTPLLLSGAGRGLGPVTRALRAMQSGVPETERERVRTLRKRIADRIEADIALLDMLSGDPDLEDGGDAEPSLGSLGGTAGARGCNQLSWSRGCDGDRELGDDTGIGDTGGLAEQRGRHLRLIAGGAA